MSNLGSSVAKDVVVPAAKIGGSMLGRDRPLDAGLGSDLIRGVVTDQTLGLPIGGGRDNLTAERRVLDAGGASHDDLDRC
jgi:hypothetical protein